MFSKEYSLHTAFRSLVKYTYIEHIYIYTELHKNRMNLSRMTTEAETDVDGQSIFAEAWQIQPLRQNTCESTGPETIVTYVNVSCEKP